MGDLRSSFTAETGFRVTNDKVSWLSLRRHLEGVGVGIAKGAPGILGQFECPEASQPCC